MQKDHRDLNLEMNENKCFSVIESDKYSSVQHDHIIKFKMWCHLWKINNLSKLNIADRANYTFLESLSKNEQFGVNFRSIWATRFFGHLYSGHFGFWAIKCKRPGDSWVLLIWLYLIRGTLLCKSPMAAIFRNQNISFIKYLIAWDLFCMK